MHAIMNNAIPKPNLGLSSSNEPDIINNIANNFGSLSSLMNVKAAMVSVAEITEANNNYQGFFGENRLKETLNKYCDESLNEILDKIKNEVYEYTLNTEENECNKTCVCTKCGKEF